MFQYWICVTEDKKGNITSLYSPDLKLELHDDNDNDEINNDYRAYTKNKLTSLLYKKNRILLPKKLEQLENSSLTKLQHWESFKININKKRGLFSKLLPGLGHTFNVIAVPTNLFVTYMSLKITAHNNSNEDSAESTFWSVLGALFNSLIGFFLYVLSDASDMLSEMGDHVDNFYRKKDHLPRNASALSQTQRTKFLSLSFLATGSILANMLIANIRQYQEVRLLAEKFLSLGELSDSEYAYYDNLIEWLVIVPNIIALSYTATAFQGGFARQLIAKLTDIPTQLDLSEANSENSTLIHRLNSATTALSIQDSTKEEQTVSTPLESDKSTLLQFKSTPNSISKSKEEESSLSLPQDSSLLVSKKQGNNSKH